MRMRMRVRMRMKMKREDIFQKNAKLLNSKLFTTSKFVLRRKLHLFCWRDGGPRRAPKPLLELLVSWCGLIALILRDSRLHPMRCHMKVYSSKKHLGHRWGKSSKGNWTRGWRQSEGFLRKHWVSKPVVPEKKGIYAYLGHRAGFIQRGFPG